MDLKESHEVIPCIASDLSASGCTVMVCNAPVKQAFQAPAKAASMAAAFGSHN